MILYNFTVGTALNASLVTISQLLSYISVSVSVQSMTVCNYYYNYKNMKQVYYVGQSPIELPL